MKSILKFLMDTELGSIDPINFPNNENRLNSLNQLFNNRFPEEEYSSHLKIKPNFKKNQIWSVKKQYYDYQGKKHIVNHPFIVLIYDILNAIEEEAILRVMPISPFVEIASKSDEICRDSSLIGFPFLVETWNDQPILAELLEDYLGYYEFQSNIGSAEKDTLTNIQKEFRSIEIDRASYLNYSISSFISFLENKQSNDSGAVISINDRSEYPKFFVGGNEEESSLSLAAKSGFDVEDKYLLFDYENLPFEIYIRKNEAGFILSALTNLKIYLNDQFDQEIVGHFDNEKYVYSNLEKGLYKLSSDQLDSPIIIRLK